MTMKPITAFYFLLFIFCLLPFMSVKAQLLDKVISVQFNKERLDNVLEIISNKGNFYFSYNSNIIRKDSIVTMTAYNKTVRQILEFLFQEKYEFRESSNYIIIRK